MPQNILVVDDEPSVLQMMATMATLAGKTPITAPGGTEALRLLSEGLHVDALVTDIVMPEMSGVELSWKLRAIHPELPILLVSGFDWIGNPEVLDLMQQGPTEYLPKPFSLSEFSHSLSKILVELHETV